MEVVDAGRGEHHTYATSDQEDHSCILNRYMAHTHLLCVQAHHDGTGLCNDAYATVFSSS